MKKLIMYLAIVVIIFGGLWGLNVYQEKSAIDKYTEKAQELYHTTPDQLSDATIKQLDNEDYQNIIVPEEFEEKLANQEDMIVYFFQPTCIYCQHTTPVLMDLAQELDVEVYQYNVYEFQDPWDHYIDGTPTMIFFDDGQETDLKIDYGLSGNEETDSQVTEAYRSFLMEAKNRMNPS